MSSIAWSFSFAGASRAPSSAQRYSESSRTVSAQQAHRRILPLLSAVAVARMPLSTSFFAGVTA